MPYPVSDGPRFVPAHDVVQLEAHYQRDGQDNVNIFHVYNASPADNLPAFAQAALNAYETWENQAIVKGVRSTNVTLSRLVARDLGSLNAAAWERTEAIAGTFPMSGVQNLPNSDTIAIKFNTGRTGRSYRGRTFWIGLHTNAVNANTLTASARDSLIAAYTDLIARMKGLAFTGSVAAPNGTRLIVLSRVQNKMYLDEAVKTEILTCSLSDLYVDVQRRRLPGRGR